MNARVALLGSCALSLLLTGCPLTDHYSLSSDEPGGASGEAGSGGAEAGAVAAMGGGAAGASASAGEGNAATGGDAGSAAEGDAPSAGTGGSGGDAAAGAGGNTGCATTCTAQQTCCGSTCVNLMADDQNCGACGTVCNAGRSCDAGSCKSGWVPTSTTTFAPRSRAAIVAMGGSVFIWGGMDGNGNTLADGAIYTPATNTWKLLPKGGGAPAARVTASAVWTGKLVIVFGGSDANAQNFYRDGGVYDPATNISVCVAGSDDDQP